MRYLCYFCIQIHVSGSGKAKASRGIVALHEMHILVLDIQNVGLSRRFAIFVRPTKRVFNAIKAQWWIVSRRNFEENYYVMNLECNLRSGNMAIIDKKNPAFCISRARYMYDS